METKKKEKRETKMVPKVMVQGKKMKEMEIKASINTCCTWQYVN